ncbi:MAG TPA: long-chain fatty acid--CoA ligase [Ilumatobacteraceae bacterium]|nr:long-chain fatty acid--CoA ligase [Ilumatobacteraceae bacterium]
MTTATLTMAALTRTAAQRHGDGVAAMFQRDGEWAELTFTDLWERVEALARGIIGLGVGPGDRVGILANTRLEFTIADLAASTAGAIVVPVYPTNSPGECEWVLGDSGAVVVVCEDADQVAKVESVRGALPDLRHVLVIDGPVAGTTSVDDVAASAPADDGELARRIDAASAEDACLIIYTSGTTGRPKGVVLTNEGFAAGRRSAIEMDLFGPGDVTYLYLPLAHVFGQLVQADCVEVGAAIAFWGGDTRAIVPELGQVHPTVLPSVPRIFEKVYGVAMGMVPEEQAAQAIRLGLAVRQSRERGEDVPPDQAAAFEQVDNEMFALVRGIFGGRIKLAISGAAPIAPEILEFFYAAGVPVFEGWGMTETTAIGTLNLPGAYRFGTIGRPVAGAEVRIAEDGEIEIAGDMVMRGYWNNPDATAEVMTDDGYLRTGDLGEIDDDGYVSITGRKKDIIITAGGKNLTPANLEGDLRRSRWISQAVMYGDRRPYPVALITLDMEEVGPWAEANGLPADPAALAEHEQVRALVQEVLDEANAHHAQVAQIKRFAILDRDFTLEAGELTPSLKLKRNVVYENYADEFDALYS